MAKILVSCSPDKLVDSFLPWVLVNKKLMREIWLKKIGWAVQLPVQINHFILYLSSSHRSEERQRGSTSRAFQRQGGRYLHCVRRGLHGGGPGETQPSEGEAAFTQGTCTLTTCQLSTLEAVPRLPSHHVRCQMKFIKLSAQAINGCYL